MPDVRLDGWMRFLDTRRKADPLLYFQTTATAAPVSAAHRHDDDRVSRVRTQQSHTTCTWYSSIVVHIMRKRLTAVVVFVYLWTFIYAMNIRT